MTRVSRASRPLLFIAFCWCASVAGADPIRVQSGFVSAGFDELGGSFNAEDLQLTAPGFHIGSSLEDEVAFVQLTTRPTVAPGALVDLSGVLHVEDPVGAQLGDSFALVTAPFTMSFFASQTRLTCGSSGGITECTGVAPFTFAAELTFSTLDGMSFTRQLVGRGRAEGRFDRLPSFESGAVQYVFEATPTPEPATMSLFATGAVLAGAGVRRKRGAQRRPAA